MATASSSSSTSLRITPVGMVCAVLSTWPLLWCSAVGDGAPADPVANAALGDVSLQVQAAEYRDDPYPSLRYGSRGIQGRVMLDVHLQRFEYRLTTTPEGPLDFDVDIQTRIAPSFRVTAFTFIGDGRMVVGGRDVRDGGRSYGRLALIDSDAARGRFERSPPEWGGAGLQSVTDLLSHPQNSCLFVLDALGGALYVCDLPMGRLSKLLDAEAHPILLQARDLTMSREHGGDKLSVRVLTEIGGDAMGRFSKPSLTLVDVGTDGRFHDVIDGSRHR